MVLHASGIFLGRYPITVPEPIEIGQHGPTTRNDTYPVSVLQILVNPDHSRTNAAAARLS